MRFFIASLLAGLFLINPLAVIADSGNQADLVAPLEGNIRYPFVKDGSLKCGKWKKGSQDYPYFGAPRNNYKRSHAGIDIYPDSGQGATVKAIKSGLVIKIAPFYIRSNGEVTYAVLVDHGDFTANYAELKRPDLTVASRLEKGQVIGIVSGTAQLHFELYKSGTADWTRGWYTERPPNLLDPTEFMLKLFSSGKVSAQAAEPFKQQL